MDAQQSLTDQSIEETAGNVILDVFVNCSLV